MKKLAEKCPLGNEAVIPQVVELLNLSRALGSCETRPWYLGLAEALRAQRLACISP